MEYLKDSLKRKIARRILQAPHTFFFLDYDGTLAPIASKPELAVLSDTMRSLLNKLATIPDFSVAVVSGRSIADIQTLVGLPNIIYAGNHGLELQGPDFKYTHAKAKESQRILKEIIQVLEPLQKEFEGSFLEDKGVTFTYHYRLMDPIRENALRLDFLNRIQPWIQSKKVRVQESKKSLAVRPNLNWNKGSAVRWILLHEDPDSLPINIGDDRTDENSFKALYDRGITIRTGYYEKSAAQYFLNDICEVEEFLSFLVAIKSIKFLKKTS